MANPTDHYLLTGLDVHSTIWKTVADAAALAALTPAAEDIGKDVLQSDDSSVHKLVETGPAVWRNITAAAAASDHGSLTGLADDDHNSGVGAYAQTLSGAGVPGVSTGNGYRLGTVYTDTTGDVGYTLADATTDANVWSSGSGGDVTSDGTTEQDAVYLAERADHVNTPGAGFGELWLKNDAPSVPMFTDDDDNDYQLGDVVGPGSSDANTLAVWDGTSGKLLQSQTNITSSGEQLLFSGSAAEVVMKERAAGPTGYATWGYSWVKNTAPTTPWFTDDDDNDYQLAAAPHVGKTAAPETTDNGAAGYQVGNIWVDETNDDAYILLDASTTAVWKKITP